MLFGTADSGDDVEKVEEEDIVPTELVESEMHIKEKHTTLCSICQSIQFNIPKSLDENNVLLFIDSEFGYIIR